MRSVLLLSVVALSLAGCAVPMVAPVQAPTAPPVYMPPPVTPAPSTATRAAAVSIVNREMAQRLPGVNVMPYTSCVVNNATMAEMADLASMGGNSAGAAGAVASIIKRPAATSCIASLSRTT